MKREINHTELFILANKRASQIIRDDKQIVRKFNRETKCMEPIIRPRKYTRAQALSKAFLEMYARYSVVDSISTKEALQREADMREYEDRARFYSSHWNALGWTGD